LNDTLSLAAARRLRGGLLPHVPPAASPVATIVRLELAAAEDACPEAVFTDPRREQGWRVALAPCGNGRHRWQAEVRLPQEPTLLRYHFILSDGRLVYESRQAEGVETPLFGVWQERDFQVAVYDPAGIPPAWVAGTVIYQIFPDRFARGAPANRNKAGACYGLEPLYLDWDQEPERPPQGRDFYGGDLRGVIDKLAYLEELAVTCIYFTPVFASPSNHRYDALDYTRIDPRLGTEEDLLELIAKAQKRGIRVLLDGVFNHCSSDSIYFKAAQASKLSPYYRWFNFEQWPGRWVGWAGVNTMPELVECPEVEEFFFGKAGIAQHWLAYGTAGWRTDVTPWITDEFWRRFRRSVRRAYPDAYLVAEDWGDATPRLLGDSFDATMNYRFGYSAVGYAGGRLSASELDDRLQTLQRDTPPPQFHAQVNLLGSHDTPRLLTTLGGKRERVMLAAALQLAYPGVPMIYYGDEVGIAGSYAEDGRRAYPWGAEDEELQAFYKRAINVRRASPALSLGGVLTVWLADPGGYAIARTYGNEVVLAVFNSGMDPLQAVIPLESLTPGSVPEGAWSDLLGLAPDAQCKDGLLAVTIPSTCAAWFRR